MGDSIGIWDEAPVRARVTGTQAAIRAFAALLDGWREQFGPREYEVLLDLLARRVALELQLELEPDEPEEAA